MDEIHNAFRFIQQLDVRESVGCVYVCVCAFFRTLFAGTGER